ncbi:hypothetical protein [Actinophytocola glycyrrhizae]|uniref:Ig-like domain-containing protein n=1 Tax=Actinophytocola glycyrrhizae TaxID=2044873 RepID=A0ABV9RX09_9PSEU
MSILRLLSAFLLAVAGTAAAAHTPAAAAVPGLELAWSAPATPSSATTRIAAAGCPTGKRVVGAFAFTSGNTRDVVITGLIPTTNSVIALASEDQDGTDDNWQLTVQAMCASPLPGQTIVTTSSAYTSANKQVTATCPAGTRMLTGGWNLNGSDGEVFLNQVAPAADLSRMSVTGMEDQDGMADTWRLTTHAVCADPLPGLFTRTATSAADSADKSVVIVCDPGQQRLSAGWSLIGSGAGSPAGQVQARPGSAGTGWYELAAVEDDDGYSGHWFATARIICVTI